MQTLQEFMISQGASKNVTLQEWDKIWSINKRIIDPVCPRHTAIAATARVPLRLTNGPGKPEVRAERGVMCSSCRVAVPTLRLRAPLAAPLPLGGR